MAWLFFSIWIRSNIFHDFSGCGRPIFKCFIIRFVFLLAFQHRIPNCSMTKTREDTVKRTRAKTMARLFFAIWVPRNILRDFSGCSNQIFNLFISLDASGHYGKNSRRYGGNSAPLPSILPLHSYDSLGARTNFCQGPRSRETTYIRACYCFASLHAASFKNQVLVLTFWIGKQNAEKHIEKGIFS